MATNDFFHTFNDNPVYNVVLLLLVNTCNTDVANGAVVEINTGFAILDSSADVC